MTTGQATADAKRHRTARITDLREAQQIAHPAGMYIVPVAQGEGWRYVLYRRVPHCRAVVVGSRSTAAGLRRLVIKAAGLQ